VVICLEQGADLHMAQLMPPPLTVSCFSKIQIGFTFLVPAHLGSPGKGPLNGCVCVCVKCLVYVCRGGNAKHQLHAVATVWSAAHQAVDRRWNARVRGECQHGLPVTHTGIYHSHSLA